MRGGTALKFGLAANAALLDIITAGRQGYPHNAD
jgi:hypothetical protein